MQKLCCFYKIFRNQSPEYLFNIIPSSVRPHNTRNANNIPQFKVKNNFFRNSFFPFVVIEWSKLDQNIPNSPPKEKIIDQTDTAIYELPDLPKIELGDPLLNILSTEVENILADDYVNDKNIKEIIIEQLKNEYKFDEIKDAFDEGAVPHQLDFFMGATMKISHRPVIFCLLTKIKMSLYLFCVHKQAKI